LKEALLDGKSASAPANVSSTNLALSVGPEDKPQLTKMDSALASAFKKKLGITRQKSNVGE
jgi:hypothetical protein